jgi:alkylation response protein AidB-like acyl-CoA dehydrogenase
MVVCLRLLLRGTGTAPTGHRVIAPCVHFEEVRIPADFLIGKPGDGLTIVSRTFSWTAALIGAARGAGILLGHRGLLAPRG